MYGTDKIKLTLVIFSLMFLYCYSVKAQYTLSTPYSYYGIGRLSSYCNQVNAALGGTGYASARNNEVNILNAASYFATDTQSFVFNIGFDFTNTTLKTNNNSSDAFMAGISNISFAFPIINRLKAGISLVPVSDVRYIATDTVFSELNYVKTYDGDGGIDRLVLGLSYQPLKTLTDELAVGINGSYYFGNLYRSTSLSFLGTVRDTNGVLHDTVGFLNNRTETNYNVSSFGIELGLQYFHKFANNHVLGIGAIFTPQYNLHANKKQLFYTYYRYNAIQYLQDTISFTDGKTHITMPMKFGLGFSYSKQDKFMAEADFTYTKWSEFGFASQELENKLKDNIRFNAGFEYIPDAYGALYVQKMAYRIGMHYDNGYIFLNGNRVTEFGISFGTALPIKKLGTKVNLSAEYGKTGTTNDNLIRENYFRIGVSISAKDRWFMKRKYL